MTELENWTGGYENHAIHAIMREMGFDDIWYYDDLPELDAILFPDRDLVLILEPSSHQEEEPDPIPIAVYEDVDDPERMLAEIDVLGLLAQNYCELVENVSEQLDILEQSHPEVLETLTEQLSDQP